MPSSSLVELKVEVWVEVGVGVEVGDWGLGQDAVQFSYFFGQVGGWEEKWRLKLTSA